MSGADSSSEEEETAKFREAVWIGGTGAHSSCTDREKNGRQSNRIDPSTHEEDGNELQTTPEFKSHVAKKLGAILDSCILEVSSESPTYKIEKCENKEEEEEDDEGFRVFSTSLPGKWWKEPSPPPAPKRPPAPSSSDSDSEMELRLREAAVSISDLIGAPATENVTEEGNGNSHKEDKSGAESTEPEKKKKKKKKKKKTLTEGTEEGELLLEVNEEVTHKQSTHEQITGELVKRKKKKKKRIKLDEGE